MIAVVVPTIREDRIKEFVGLWEDLFKKHGVELITIWDGEDPILDHKGTTLELSKTEVSELVFSKNDGCRNFGFWYIAKNLPDVEYIITLDDDVSPIGDTIKDHIDALNMRVPIDWFSTLLLDYPRGFPYGIRKQAPVAISHGVWKGVKDWDAPTQLVRGNPEAYFYVGAIPKGVLYPMCGMNLAFKREMLPYMYFAPMGPEVGVDRFADIWCGIESKKICDENNWAVVTGYAKVLHDRASSVWKNLQKEALGLEMNENYNQGEYFDSYKELRKTWQHLILQLI